jgi:hypothetical protein
VSCLLAGAYPPNSKQWQWNNGSDAKLGLHWQPFPIETFIPKDDDGLLRMNKKCPNADKELHKISKSDKVLSMLEENEEFLKNLSKLVGKKINSLTKADSVRDVLNIEYNRGYKWSDMKVWSKDYEKEVFDKLLPIAKFLWIVEYDNRLIERTRAGNLIHELVKNMKNKIHRKSTKNYKLFLYSTHDTMLAVLMHALNVFNNEFIPFSASLLFELHQNELNNNYFVRIYYYNETLTQTYPYLLSLPNCDYLTDCPLDKFFSLTKELIPEDWDKECGIEDKSLVDNKWSFNLLVVILLVICLVLIILLVYNKFLLGKRQSYQTI